MIEKVLENPVVWWSERGDPPGATLLPGEGELVARAVDKRRRDFTTGRHCARRALARLGIAPAPLLAGPAGEPLWPAGVVGSITHCAGYRAAAVAWSSDVPTIGIDAEPHEPLPEGVLDLVALPDERTQLRELSTAVDATTRWDRLLFSAKEAVYKAWYPHGREMLDFADARVRLDPTGTFRADLLIGADRCPPIAPTGRRLRGFTGRWATGDGLVVAAISTPLT
jgi:4'-phosphopantetheinyl transferase EntD